MEQLALDDFTRYKFISSTKFSPNGENVAFVVHEMDVDENKYLSNIWLYNVPTNKISKLTSFNQESSFAWLDENNIMFSTVREEKDKKRIEKGEPFTIYYKININGGEAVKYFEIPLVVTKIESLKDGNFVLTGIYDRKTKDLISSSPEEKEKLLEKLREEKDYEILDEIPFWSNGEGFTNKKRNRLYVFSFDEKKLIPITDELTNVEAFKVSPDNSNIVYISNSFKDKLEIRSDLYLYNIYNRQLEKLTHEDPFSYAYADFMKDKIIFLGSNMKKYGVNENPKFYVMNMMTKEVEQIHTDFDYSTWSSVGSDCRYGSNQEFKVEGNYFYFETTEYGNSYINRIDENGKREKLITKNGSVDGFDVFGTSIVFVGMRDNKLQELYKLKDKSEMQVTTFNEWVVKEKSLSRPERITFNTKEGIEIEGWIMKPIDFDETKKYPAILDIHGGPKTVYSGEVFFHEMQYWSNIGYVVMFCNPRGSDGRGDEFADIRGKYGTIDYQDIIDFVDVVLDKFPFVDENRLGVTGGSYGGFMTNWIIGHTNRFKAAASQRSIANWISKFGTTDIGYYFVEDQQAATPWTNYEKLWFHSPMKYADRVKTPTLFIHSEEDYRCWLAEGLQMFTSLKYNDVEAKLVLFRGENHELSRSGKPKNRIRRLKEISEWFDELLKPNT
ncbi:MAG TPA: S9 family peptidase [Defluviitoga sp.]|nr:S9 family peptidase [Defluviitoga sp.]HOP23701.1 S9 family peptidase [Defluviitoga sp.]HPZ28969.1 S9 family peptidase [Defluviitoga sp.]HQD63014.1 S9 family peptidase [Defluviitoga sp.]